VKVFATRHDSVVAASTAGRVAGGLLIFGALSTFAAVWSGSASNLDPARNVLVASIVAVIGVVSLAVPWNRWGQASTLVLLPPVFALLAYGNYANPDPYLAGIFFVVIAMWAGLCHTRTVTRLLAPVIAVCYWWPLSVQPHLDTLDISAVIITAVCVTIGEVLGLMRSELAAVQRRLLQARERRFAALVRRSADVTLVFDAEGVIRYVSPAVQSTFGYPPDAIEGHPLADFAGQLQEVDSDEVLHLLTGAVRPSVFDEVGEVRIRHADGHWVDVESVAQDHLDDPDVAGIVVHLRDIGGRKRLERDLQFQAFHDELTQLPNRTLFRAMVSEQIAGADPAVVAFLDLDGFKAINDTAGHANGDLLLQAVAQRLRGLLDEEHTLSRLGGDEFAVLYRADLPTALDLTTALVRSLEAPFELGHNLVTVSASAGLAEYRGCGGADDLIRDADTAMYEAKTSRSGRVTPFEAHMRTELVARLQTEALLRTAIERDEFVLHYQPIVDLRSGTAGGAEALVRWNHPVRGLTAPGEFIGIAEESGLIVPLGRWVLATACRDAAEWTRLGGVPRYVAVNVSVRQFQDPSLVDDVRAALDRSGLPPELLTIEVTESVLAADADAAAQRLAQLRTLGVCLALDDFGTGYSSLSYLHSLPFDVLKIDQSFISRAAHDASARSLVQTIDRLGHDLGLRTLVEGVENAAQAELATEIGCDYAQGYHYARPVPADALPAAWERLLARPGISSRAGDRAR
jgi:diguanylate cyclase (GGDEF)-like protein/PAS domain S-box-containing protein